MARSRQLDLMRAHVTLPHIDAEETSGSRPFDGEGINMGTGLI